MNLTTFDFPKFFALRLRYLLSGLLILLSLSCRTQNIEQYEPFDQDSAIEVTHLTGTHKLWHEQFNQVLKSGKPRALILDHGEESLILRINLIRSAQKSISIQTFSWEFDEVGKFILWELIKANQERGVKVKLLIDHMFNEHQPEMIAFLSTLDPNFKIKYFNPSAKKLSPSFLEKISDLAIDFHDHNARLHNKLFLIDNVYAITGGRNINNHYFDQVIGMNYKDRDVFLISPDSQSIINCFQFYWDSIHSVSTRELVDIKQVIQEGGFPRSLDKKRFFDYNIFNKIELHANDEILIKNLFINPLIEVDRVDWIYDLPDKVEKAPDYDSEVSRRLRGLMKFAESEIFIQSPYVVLSRDTQQVFSDLKRDGVKVVISTNSLAATDNWATYAANYSEKRVYLEELGLEIWEFKPIPEGISEFMSYDKLLKRKPFKREFDSHGVRNFKISRFPLHFDNESILKMWNRVRENQHLKTAPYLSLHAKSSVIDGNISFVGSFNLDPRSEIYNTELGLIIYDEQFSKSLKKSILEDITPQNSFLIGIKKKKIILSLLNKLFYRVSEAIPFLDPWPIRSHTSFDLKPGMQFVEPGHIDFYKNWKDVGNFPTLSFFAKKQLSARIFKATGMILKPLL